MIRGIKRDSIKAPRKIINERIRINAQGKGLESINKSGIISDSIGPFYMDFYGSWVDIRAAPECSINVPYGSELISLRDDEAYFCDSLNLYKYSFGIVEKVKPGNWIPGPDMTMIGPNFETL